MIFTRELPRHLLNHHTIFSNRYKNQVKTISKHQPHQQYIKSNKNELKCNTVFDDHVEYCDIGDL